MLSENALHIKIQLHQMFQNQHFNWQVQSHEAQNCSAFNQYNVGGTKQIPLKPAVYFIKHVLHKMGLSKALLGAYTK